MAQSRVVHGLLPSSEVWVESLVLKRDQFVMLAGTPKGPDYQDPRTTLNAAIQYIRNEADRLGMPRIARALDRVVVMLEEMMTETRMHGESNEKNDDRQV